MARGAGSYMVSAMMYFATGSPDARLDDAALRRGLFEALGRLGERRRVIAVPPDATRAHSGAGLLTAMARQYYGAALTDVLPAIGTHAPMRDEEIARLFPGVPTGLFRTHDWRHGTVALGEVPASFVRQVTGGAVDFAWPAEVAERLVNGGHDLILSVGRRSEERRVGKECRSRWSPYH